MLTALGHSVRLARAMLTFARHAVFGPEWEFAELPSGIRRMMRLSRLAGRLIPAGRGKENSLAAALVALGPSYIKLGQFLATRPDIVGTVHARDLAALRDRLPPFPRQVALDEIRSSLAAPVETLFTHFGEPVAAASIAQVHKAQRPAGINGDDADRVVAVKILRPGIEKRLGDDLDSFFFAAGLIERNFPAMRRLKLVETVKMLAQSVKIEMDLRLEAAAISEMAENIANDAGFRVPMVDWSRTSRRVLTTEWIEGIALSDIESLKEAGHDCKKLADTLMRSFLKQVIRDGFFHADLHQGNLFVDSDGAIVAVDFGITGRLDRRERRFLAEILWGFTRRDYSGISRVHFEAGYVPHDRSPALFAQALRAIGEPIMKKPANEISMARLLGQLFLVTEQFNMATQTGLLLLQKTMVVVEGVARGLDPQFDMWRATEPVLRDWAKKLPGHDAAEAAETLKNLASDLPGLLGKTERMIRKIADNALSDGVRFDDTIIKVSVDERRRRNHSGHIAFWICVGALIALVLVQLL